MKCYDDLTQQLDDALREYPPNLERAQSLVDQGADIHARNEEDEGENILAQIILGYPDVFPPEDMEDEAERDAFWKSHNGRYLPDIVHFFLQNGFDVTKENGRYGADCLRNLTWASYDIYILDATKLLLDAGASYEYADEDSETVIDWVGTKAGASSITNDNDESAQLFCTMWEILDAHRKGQDYHGIDSCLHCEGLRIDQIFMPPNTLHIEPDAASENQDTYFFSNPFVFLCEGVPLRFYPYAELAIDHRYLGLPEQEDASGSFPDIAGQRLMHIRFPDFSEEISSHKDIWFVLELENGLQLLCDGCKRHDQRNMRMRLHWPDIEIKHR